MSFHSLKYVYLQRCASLFKLLYHSGNAVHLHCRGGDWGFSSRNLQKEKEDQHVRRDAQINGHTDGKTCRHAGMNSGKELLKEGDLEKTEAKTRNGRDKEKEMDRRRGAGEKSKVAALTVIAITRKSL